MINNLAPIVLFVYNRPSHTLKTLEALADNILASESVLYIYADGIKDNSSESVLQDINTTRAILRKKMWCKEVHIIESSFNKGLAKSIIEGVTEVLDKHGKIIVLEDDIVTSPIFLNYMNEALTLYENNKKVMHIGGYVPLTTGAKFLPDSFFVDYMYCWGWATWKDSWSLFIDDINYIYDKFPSKLNRFKFDLDGSVGMYSQIIGNIDGTIKTWAVKWYASILLNNGLCLYPQYSLVDNIGIDGSGEHCFSSDDRWRIIPSLKYKLEKKESRISLYARNYLKRFHRYGTDSSLTRRIKNIVLKIIKY